MKVVLYTLAAAVVTLIVAAGAGYLWFSHDKRAYRRFVGRSG